MCECMCQLVSISVSCELPRMVPLVLRGDLLCIQATAEIASRVMYSDACLPLYLIPDVLRPPQRLRCVSC